MTTWTFCKLSVKSKVLNLIKSPKDAFIKMIQKAYYIVAAWIERDMVILRCHAAAAGIITNVTVYLITL